MKRTGYEREAGLGGGSGTWSATAWRMTGGWPATGQKSLRVKAADADARMMDSMRKGGARAVLAAALRQRVLQQSKPRAERVHLRRQHHGAQLPGVQRRPNEGCELHRDVPAVLRRTGLLRVSGRRAARGGGARDAPRRRGGRGDAGARRLRRRIARGRERP